MDESVTGKLQRLREILASLPSALVAYSGGVDSTLLAFVAREVLEERMKAVIVDSPLLPPRELERARRIASSLGLPLEVVQADELALPGFDRNPPDRCYACKGFRLGLLRDMADREGLVVLLEGANLDDAKAHRPGRRAAAEAGALSPLEEAGMTKADVRAAARGLGIPNWDAPSRPCLATRFPYGMSLQREFIAAVDAAEAELEAAGMREFRVRLDAPGEARIEVGTEEMALLDDEGGRYALVKKLGELGLRRVKLDLEGFRSGSMDEDRENRRCRILLEGGGRADDADG